MLNGSQLSIAISVVLAGAVILGWVLHWLWSRAHRRPASAAEQMQEMATRLHEADKGREAAEEAQERAENLLSSREAEMTTRVQAMQHRVDGAVEGREADLAQRLREAEADSAAAMDGLGLARRRIADLEQALEETASDGRVTALEAELSRQTDTVAELSTDLAETTDALSRTRVQLQTVEAELAKARETLAAQSDGRGLGNKSVRKGAHGGGKTQGKSGGSGRKRAAPQAGGKAPR